jgi:hypothetical protein
VIPLESRCQRVRDLDCSLGRDEQAGVRNLGEAGAGEPRFELIGAERTACAAGELVGV